MKAKLTITSINKTYKVEIQKVPYLNNGSLALEAVCGGEDFSQLSTNFPESKNLPPNQCYFKTWSENDGFLEQLEAQGLVKRLGPVIQSGFVQAPLVEVLF